MRSDRRAWLLVLACAGVARAAVTADPPMVRMEEPRAYGWTVGDVLTRRAVFSVPAAYRLPERALPRPGRTGAWFELREPRLESGTMDGRTRFVLELSYQVINAPEEVRTLILPELTLPLEGPAPAEVLQVPEWPVTVAPITPMNVLARAGLDEVQPDIDPPPIDAAMPVRRLSVYAALAAVVGAWLAFLRWGVPIPASRAPFARAARDLKRLRRSAGASADSEIVRRVHRAFDETAGRTVFADTLSEFFAQRPRFAPLREEIEAFYEASRRSFFGSARVPDLSARAADLCRRCRAAERKVA